MRPIVPLSTAAALRRNPRILLLKNPFAPLSTAAAAALETPPPPSSTSAAAEALDHLKSAIRSEPNPNRLITLFESGVHNKQLLSDRSLYSFTVRKLVRAGRRDLIERLLDHSSSGPSAPQSDGFLARIITLYASAGMLDHAVRTFDRAVAAGRPLGERSLCALLTSFVKAGQVDRAVGTFNNVPKQLNITPGIVPHNILLHVLCKKGDVDAARQLLDEMSYKHFVKPDIISYTTVLDGYLSKGDEAGFTQILNEIDGKGLVASVVTYNCIIMALCRKNEMLKAEGVLDLMVSKKVQPNRASFKNIIEGLYEKGDMESSLRVFKRMKATKKTDTRNDPSPDSDTYNMLISGLVKKGEFGSAMEVCNDCFARKLIPPFEAVKGLAVGLRNNSKVDEAKVIVKRMRASLKDSALDTWKKVESELSL